MASGPSSSFQSHLRSQSSVQLLGFIENCIRVDVPETTDEGELRIKGYETLINTSTSVLSCIQVRYSNPSSATLAATIRSLRENTQWL